MFLEKKLDALAKLRTQGLVARIARRQRVRRDQTAGDVPSGCNVPTINRDLDAGHVG